MFVAVLQPGDIFGELCALAAFKQDKLKRPKFYPRSATIRAKTEAEVIEILPNILGPMMVEATLRLTYSIAVISALAGLGRPDLVDCALRLYLARRAYRIARPADLIADLTTVFPNAAAVLAPYGLRS